jgi:hypothetical protein
MRVAAKRALMLHPDLGAVQYQVGVKVAILGQEVLQVEFAISGDVTSIRWPESRTPDRTDGLWHSTCFEVFVGQADGGYVEHNFSPSKAWASYRFESYREGMQPAFDLPQPPIFPDRTAEQCYGLTAFIELGLLPSAYERNLALSAVIEENDGTKSYWALKHPPGPPDFHHPDCFALTLPAPG